MDYYKRPEMSRSKLCDLDNLTPYHWYRKHIAQDLPQDSTPALEFGKAFHTYILEPHKFYNEFAVPPTIDKRTKEGKEVYNQFIESSENKTILSSKDHDIIVDLHSSIISNKEVKAALESCDLLEEELFFTLDDIDFKAKLDAVDTKNHIIYDLKSMAKAYTYDIYTNQISNKFFYDMQKYNNDAQTYIYTEAYRQKYGVVPRFAFLSIEKKKPYEVQFIDVEHSFIECGEIKTHRLIDMYKTLLDQYGNKPWISNKLYAEAPVSAQPDIVLHFDDEDINIWVKN